MIAQRTLNLTINERTVLVDTNAVRAARGVDAETVFSWVEHGELQWVFDISTSFGRDNSISELRFWALELIAPEVTRNLHLEEVIDRILPRNRAWLHGSEIERLLLVSRPTVKLIRESIGGAIVNHSSRIERSALSHFFRSRCAAFSGRLSNIKAGAA